MPLVAFSSLPDDARVWVFGSDDALSAESEAVLLSTVDDYLSDWRAHGSPLTVSRDWQEGRFLVIAVDQRDEHASGCSLDALFRVLRDVESRLSTSILGNSRVYFRGNDGTIRSADRAAFAELAQEGSIGPGSKVFDLSVQTVAEWRSRFEVDAADSWHRGLLPVAV